MTCLSKLPALLLPIVLVACSTTVPTATPSNPAADLTAASIADESNHEAILLVSLDDGTVIKQTISVNADVCFKQNSNSSTTCFKQGEPIVNNATNTVIGFEMIEDHIDLIAKTN